MAPLLASALLAASLDNEDFTLNLPRGVAAVKHRLTFETDSYDIVVSGNATPLMTILVGGGTSDVHGYGLTCLSGRKIWRRESNGAVSIVFGWLGVDSVTISIPKLEPEREKLAKSIVESIEIKAGPACSSG